MELLTTAQMRAAEHAAIAGGQVTGLELMERAGRGVVEAVFAQWPALAAAPGHAVLLCGPGNNGGDGFVVARLLAERGWSADVFLYGSAARLPPDAAETCRLWQEIGVVRPWHPEDVRRARGDLFVDALFGAGLSRGLPEEIAAPLTDLCADLCATPGAAPGADGQTGARMVAVDAPSGLCLDSGRNLNAGTGRDAVLAALTVTFHRPRPGHFIEEGPRHCGALRCVDIGLGPDALTGAAGAPGVAGPSPGPGATGPGSGAAGIALASAPLPEDLRKQNAAHKYTHGHALVLSGGVGKGGAARLAARGSLRIGAGLVTLGCPPAAMIENAARLDAVMLRPIADADALTEMLSDPRITALCLGPGLGLERARALVPAALALPAQEKAASSVPGRRALHRAVHRAVHRGAHRAVQRDVHRAVLLDADALSAFADDPAVLFAALHPACVLTPHMGEFARLFPDLAARLDAPASTGPAHSPARSPARSPISSPAFSKVDAVREAAVRAGCTVLLKGPDTVIAGPDGTARISPALTSPTLTSPALTSTALQARAAPWLATAGSGDVLAGFITGLLARGFAPLAAAEIGAWLHVDCALAFGPGLIAEDLPDQLPAVFRNLGI